MTKRKVTEYDREALEEAIKARCEASAQALKWVVKKRAGEVVP